MLIHLLSTMKNSQGEITIDGLHDNVIPPTTLELEAVSRLPLDLAAFKAEMDLDQLDQPVDRPFYDRLMFHPTFTINGSHSGYGGPGSKTVLPHEAVVKCDIRLVDGRDPEEVLGKVAADIERVAPGVEFIPLDGMLPSKTPMEFPLCRTFAKGDHRRTWGRTSGNP